jgi:hypothetical protein
MADDQSHRNGNGPQAGNIVRLVGEAWAISVEVFLRSRFGSRYIGAKGAIVVLIVPFFIMFWKGHDPRPLLCFLVAYLGLCVLTRIGGLVRRMRGEGDHSRYSGWPRLCRAFPWLSEVAVKTYVEPCFVLGVAGLVGNWNPPLAAYLGIGALCLLMNVLGNETWIRQRAMDINDAVYEQQSVAERFREMRGENY